MAITKYEGILYGGDYCPEQWDEATWQEDIRIMKYYGVNTVTLNVHSWCVLQPVEGPYDFTAMDRIVRLLEENGIQIIMATGTAALPHWMLEKYPDIMAQGIDGTKEKPAKRVNYCTHSANFRREIQRMCEALAEHYQGQENIILWHLSNELERACYCDHCAAEYRKWLQKKYGSLDVLNARWNTMFWGHQYTSWEQINPPAYDNMVYRNVDGKGIDISAFPTETIEYLRFVTEGYRQCLEIEKEAIRKFIPDALVTNNIQYLPNREFQYDRLADVFDVASCDSYPVKGEEPYISAFHYDLTRSLKNQDPFLVMEMSPNHASWQLCAPVKRPGELAKIAMMALARGAESALYFQIRRCRSGFEKFHGAMISHAGREDTRIGRELKALGDTLKRLGNTFLGSRIHADAAIVMDWDSRWGVQIPSNIQKGTRYMEEVSYYYEWFYSQNIMTDIVRPGGDLTKYKVIAAPMMYMMDEEIAENIKKYVRQGGTFIMTYYSGIADYEDNVWLGGYPGLLRDMFGMWVEETDALEKDEENQVRLNTAWGRGEYSCGYMCDLIRVEEAGILGTYGKDFYEGSPCITENQYGAGKAVYIGTKPDKELLDVLLSHYCGEKEAHPVFQTPCGVEAAVREKDGEKFLFLINHNDTEETIKFKKTYRNLADGEAVDQMVLPHNGFAVIEIS